MVRQEGEHVHLHCFAGCDRRDVREQLGVAPRPYFAVPVAPRPYARHGSDFGPIETTYAYTDRESGQPLRKNRHQGKTFSWESQGPDGRWQRGRGGVRPGIYHQAEIVHAPPGSLVFWAGGEKGADALRARGELATCNPDGDGSWEPDFAEPVRDKTVIMLPDNDTSGHGLARRSAQDAAGIVHHIYTVELPGLGDKEDVYDFLARGGTVEQIVRLALAAGEARPPDPFPDPTTQAADIARDLEAARDRLSLTFSVDRNAHLGALRHSAVQVINHVAAAIDRGEVDEDGAARVYVCTMATSAGISRGQLGRHLDRLAAWGIITKRVSRTLEDGAWKSVTYIGLVASPEETLRQLAVFQPDEQTPLRVARRCPDCGETAAVRKRWDVYCTGCGQVLDQGDELVTPACDLEDDLKFTSATSEPSEASSLSDGSLMVRSATSAPPARRRALHLLRQASPARVEDRGGCLTVPNAPSASEAGPAAGPCPVCERFAWRPPGALVHGWACSDCRARAVRGGAPSM
jgi:hypothetical protein